jgi:hypothetical protein
MTPSGEDHSSGDEGRLRDYLDELRQDPPRSDPELADRVVRGARWQQAARGPLQAIGLLLATLAEGISDLLGAERRPRR